MIIAVPLLRIFPQKIDTEQKIRDVLPKALFHYGTGGRPLYGRQGWRYYFFYLFDPSFYSGYFSYPDMRLYQGERKDFLPFYYMDPKCTDKEIAVEQDFYTGEDITVYKILTIGKWHYCSKETYDAIQIGDILKNYELYDSSNLTFIVKKPEAALD